MIKLPSVRYIAENAKAAFNRFPYVILCAVLCAFLSILLVEMESDDFWFIKLLMTCGLGLSLFFSLTLYLEKPLASFKPNSLALLGGGTLLLAGFYFLSGDAPTKNFFMNYTQWALVFHLLAAFSPFLAKGEANGFWQFNRSLFLRFLLSALYSAVFFLGIALALGAIDHLLGVDVRDKLYFEIWVFSAFVLQTWHFTAGIPKELPKLERDDSYPNGLKIFTQYLLIPLVTLYLVILYLYMGKIVYKWDWPKGIVTWLVSLVSVAGVFNLLLLYPVQEKKENGWVRVYAKVFYLSLFPLVALLFIAVGKRIGQYGVTEQRYFVSALGVWILCIALYFLLRKGASIKAIPVTLFIITLLTSVGPWGAYSVSRRSQMDRLQGYFEKNGLWNGGKVSKVVKEIPLEDRKEISSILDYLVENHGVAPLKGWFDLDLSQWEDEKKRHRYGYNNVSTEICKSLGFEYVSKWEQTTTGKFFNYNAAGGGVIGIAGYDRMVEVSWAKDQTLDGKAYSWRILKEKLVFNVEGEAVLSFDLSGLLAQLEASVPAAEMYKVPPGKMTLEAEGSKYRGKLVLKAISGNRKEGKVEFHHPQGFLLLKQ